MATSEARLTHRCFKEHLKIFVVLESVQFVTAVVDVMGSIPLLIKIT